MVGVLDGNLVGASLDLVGLDAGELLNCKVGLMVGVLDGNLVGASLDLFLLGLDVGELLNCKVGLGVGTRALVGELVMPLTQSPRQMRTSATLSNALIETTSTESTFPLPSKFAMS